MIAGNYRRPKWLHIHPFDFTKLAAMDNYIHSLGLSTVCKSACCPNRAICFSRQQVTFLILGEVCTRHCAFCAVIHGIPDLPNLLEAQRIGQAVKELSLARAVVTSVTRDDLRDGGASQYSQTVIEIRKVSVDTIIEILIPDFGGSLSALEVTVGSGPDIIGHNIDTVPRLYPSIRPQANYERSLNVLKKVKGINSRVTTKSGLMLGLGESKIEVIDAMADLRKANCDVLTIGQYLAPSREHKEPARYAPLDEFEQYHEIGINMGFSAVSSAPLVRSSFYNSDK